MRGTLLLSFVTFSAFCRVDAITLHKRDVPAVVELGIEGKVRRDRLHWKRDDTLNVVLDNLQSNLYLANLTLGTPEQHFRVVLDTGSSDLWVNAVNSTGCTRNDVDCSPFGTYNASKSSSYKYVNPDFNITYVDGHTSSGEYATEILHISGAKLDEFQFGIGYETNSYRGILGIGYSANVAAPTTYPNLPEHLVSNGHIKSNAYSLWLDDLNASTGSILFGGVNRAKYHGDLQTLPVQPVNGQYVAFFVALTDMALQSDSKSSSYSSSDFPLAMLLDSGATLTYLPNRIVSDIYSDFDVIYSQHEGVGYLPCSMRRQDYNVTYTFSGVTISVSIDELLLGPVGDENGNVLTIDGEYACMFGIAPGGNSLAILGDTFLRSAYVVYDLDNHEISLAQTNFDPGEDDILEIGTGDDAVPAATRVSDAVTTAPNAFTNMASPTATLTGPEGTHALGTGVVSTGLAALPTSDTKLLVAGLAGGILLGL